MSIKQWLTACLPTGKMRRRIIISSLLSVCVLLCGFSWTWVVEFTASVIFPVEDAVYTGLILDFADVVNVDDLKTYLTEPLIAEQIANGVRANLSAHVYDGIELPDMTQEDLGKKIISTIFDRLLS